MNVSCFVSIICLHDSRFAFDFLSSLLSPQPSLVARILSFSSAAATKASFLLTNLCACMFFVIKD